MNNVEELIFCSDDISSQRVIKTMLDLSDANIDYKIAPPQSISIIGSNSIDTAGDLYVVNVNAITNEKNLRNKRLFDVVVAFVLLISYPFTLWWVNEKSGFIKNIFNVLWRSKSWVGYHKVHTESYLSLPVLLPGVLKTTDLLDIQTANNSDTIDKINLLYARDYKVSSDIEIVFKAFNKLGQN